MTEIERIDQLREELHRHNYNYYVLNAPEITDQEFDKLMRELQDLEEKHPEHRDENSPSMRVGSDINKNFTQVVHKYPMLSLANTYSETEVTEFYDRVKKSLNEDFEICCEMKYDQGALADYLSWYPEYKSEKSEKLCPTLVYHMDYWQFSSSRAVAGINGRVDMNIQFIRR